MKLQERSAAAVLFGIAGLHALWGLGASWPAADRETLSDVVAGRPSVPGPAACMTVAGLLMSAGVLVSGRPRRLPRVRRAGAGTVAAVLGVRGAAGLSGRTDLVAPGSVSPRFRRLDRRYYSPLCLWLAVAALSRARH